MRLETVSQDDLFGELYWRGPTGKGVREMYGEVRRELAVRRRVFPRWVTNGRISQVEANYQIDCLVDMAALLELLAAKEGRPIRDTNPVDKAREALG